MKYKYTVDSGWRMRPLSHIKSTLFERLQRDKGYLHARRSGL